MYHSANFDHSGAGRDRQLQLLAQAEHDSLVKLAWLPGARRRAAKREIEREWELWQTMFCRLMELIARSGFNVKRQSELGYWVSQQRAAYGAGDLDERRSGLLERLPGWSWAASTAGEFA
ncbi:MAG: helicase associated domain-containing protein [Verrucomicrobiota bacterium]